MIAGEEVFGIVAAIGLTLYALHRARAGSAGTVMALVVIFGAGAGMLVHHDALQARAAVRTELLAEAPAAERSEDGFASSDACRACHPREHQTWHDSYHRTMTQLATPEAIVADFDGVTLDADGREYHLSREGDAFFVDMIDPGWEEARARKGLDLGPPPSRPRVKRRVVMTTGSHYMQTYWVDGEKGNEAVNLPFVFDFESQRWIPREHVFLRPPDAGPFRQRWNDNCLGCHATFGQPKRDKKGFKTQVAELGIACEACHGPAQEHAEKHRGVLGRYAAHLDDLADDSIFNPARASQQKSAEACGQCHSKAWINDARKFNTAGLAFRPGAELAKSKTVVLPRSKPDHPWLQKSIEMDPAFADSFFWSDGMIRVSGREYNGMVESKCFSGGEMTCLSCHELHGDDPDMQLRSDRRDDESCRACHPKLFEDVSAHTHHEPDSAGSSCLNCHMPFTSYGLLRAMRSHLIDSPTVAASVETGRPNACSQCHLDRPLSWAAQKLEAWYGTQTPPLEDADRTVAAGARWLLEGDAGQRALMAWSFGWADAREAADETWFAPFLAVLLEDPYAVVRYIADRSLRQLPGFDDFTYDFLAAPPERAQARLDALQRWRAQSRDAALHGRGELLLDGAGDLDEDALASHLAARNDRPLELKE